MTTRLVLVRHATCAQTHSVLLGRAIDAPLDEHGERQAGALAARLANEDAALVETSPRRRTLQTAEAIAARAQRDLRTAAALDEVDFGRWAGQSFEALAGDPDWQRWNAERDRASTPAGEDMPALQARIADHLRIVGRAYPGESIIVVTHAELIRAALLHFLDLPVEDYHTIAIEPASVTRLRLGGAGVDVESINECVFA